MCKHLVFIWHSPNNPFLLPVLLLMWGRSETSNFFRVICKEDMKKLTELDRVLRFTSRVLNSCMFLIYTIFFCNVCLPAWMLSQQSSSSHVCTIFGQATVPKVLTSSSHLMPWFILLGKIQGSKVGWSCLFPSQMGTQQSNNLVGRLAKQVLDEMTWFVKPNLKSDLSYHIYRSV